MPYFLIIPYAAILAVYCVFEKKNKFWHATVLKVVLSAFAAGCALYGAIVLSEAVYYIFAAGLICAVPADFFLQYIKTDLKKYRFGIFFFGAMHVCLLVSFFASWGISYWEFVIWAAFVLTLLLFQQKQNWKMGKEKAQLTIYTVLVTFMAAKAVSLAIISFSAFTLAAALGGLFFFVSDVFLGIWDYHKESFVFLALNRIIYFAGQLCLSFYLLLML